jgi:hypothetical protein
MNVLNEKLLQDIERMSDAELRLLQKFIADFSLAEDDPTPDEVEALQGTFKPDDYVLWQPAKPS